MLKWLALIGNEGVSIISSENERLPIIIRRFGWIKALFLGKYYSSNEAFEAYETGNGKELGNEELQNIATQIEPATRII